MISVKSKNGNLILESRTNKRGFLRRSAYLDFTIDMSTKWNVKKCRLQLSQLDTYRDDVVAEQEKR